MTWIEALTDAGFEITLASPVGGPAPIDPSSLKPKGENDALVERFLADAGLQARIETTTKAADVDGAQFDAVFFPDGHGTMWDLPSDAGVTRAVERAFAASKPIAAVCHGPAGLVSARRPDGQPLVQGLPADGATLCHDNEIGCPACWRRDSGGSWARTFS